MCVERLEATASETIVAHCPRHQNFEDWVAELRTKGMDQ